MQYLVCVLKLLFWHLYFALRKHVVKPTANLFFELPFFNIVDRKYETITLLRLHSNSCCFFCRMEAAYEICRSSCTYYICYIFHEIYWYIHVKLRHFFARKLRHFYDYSSRVSCNSDIMCVSFLWSRMDYQCALFWTFHPHIVS